MWLEIGTYHAYQYAVVPRKHFLVIFNNSEANASELLKNIEHMFPRVDYGQMTVWNLVQNPTY